MRFGPALGWQEVASLPPGITASLSSGITDISNGSRATIGGGSRATIGATRASKVVHRGIQQATHQKQKQTLMDFSDLLSSELLALREAFEKSSEKLLASSRKRDEKIAELERDYRVRKMASPSQSQSPNIFSNRGTLMTDAILCDSASHVFNNHSSAIEISSVGQASIESGNNLACISAPLPLQHLKKPISPSVSLIPGHISGSTSLTKLEPHEADRHSRSASPYLSAVVPISVPGGAQSSVSVPGHPSRVVEEVIMEHENDEDSCFQDSIVLPDFKSPQDLKRPAGELAQDVALEDDSNGELLSDEGSWSFAVLPSWAVNVPKLAKSSTTPLLKAKARSHGSLRNRTFKFKDLMIDNDKGALCTALQSWTIHPGSMKRAWWDMMSICLVFYDLVTIPLQLFDLPESAALTIMIWVTRIFWTIDLPLSFMTGYIKTDGSLEMRISRITRRYVGTWFSLDIFLVALDWMEASWTEGFGYMRIGKSSRIFRILRLVRLLRMLRMGSTISMAFERLQSEQLWVFADILKIVIIVLGLAHVIACVWYGIGASDSPTQLNWVNQHLSLAMSISEKYAMCLHWSLSQFTGGMDEMRPHTFGERVYAIIIFVFAFIMASVIVSSLTSSMTRLHFISSQQSKQILQLRRYLYQNNISEELTLRIQRNAQHAILDRTTFTQEVSVELLGVVSEPLRVDLHFELYFPVFEMHPFFRTYLAECPQVMRRVCHRATVMTLAAPGDTMFDAGEIPQNPKMYFLVSGSMQYVSISGQVYPVEAFQWISEATLWTSWMHLGVLTATSECRVVVLDARSFQDIVGQYDHVDFTPNAYANEFVESLNKADEEITDLPLIAVRLQQSLRQTKNAMSKRMTLSMKRRSR